VVVEEREHWLRSARRRYRRLLTTVVLCCVLLLLAGFVAVSRGELFRAPMLLGPPGGQQLVAGYVGPLVTEPSFLLSWQEADASWAPAVEIPGRYESACLYRGLLYVFFDDRSYSSYRRGEHVERELFTCEWTPASVVVLGEEMVAFGGVGEKGISAASLRGGQWVEGPGLKVGDHPVGNLQAVALADKVAVCWQEEGEETGGPERGIFLDTFDGQHWGEVRVATLGPVRGCALGKEPGGGVTIVSLEPEARGGGEKLWERVGHGETWRGPQPVNLPHAFLGGRVLDFSLAEGVGGPQLVVSRAGGIEAYERQGTNWERVALLLQRGWPGGLSVRAWFLLSLAALALLGVATVLLFVRLGSMSEGAVHSEIGYASLVERGVAVVFDMLLIGVGVLLLSDIYDPKEAGLATALSQVVYATVLEAYWGQTVGKRLVGIVVATPSLEAIGLRRSFVRNTLRLVDSFPAYLIGVVSVLFSPQRQRVGDRLAGTVVLRESTLLVPRAATLAAKSDGSEPEEAE
jgi:uncharacterized RDD family membrane protein YckC